MNLLKKVQLIFHSLSNYITFTNIGLINVKYVIKLTKALKSVNIIMSLDFEDKLNSDLEFFKIIMTIDVEFIIYLESLNLKEHFKIISYDSYHEIIVGENRDKKQYIAINTETITVKKLLWCIPYKRIKNDYYDILGEIQWEKNNLKTLNIKIWGESALHLLKEPIKKWALDNEFFVIFNVLAAQNEKYYINEQYIKRWHDKDYKFIKKKK